MVLSFIGAGNVVGGLVRLQRRQRAQRRSAGHQRLRQYPVRRRRRRHRLGIAEWLQNGKPTALGAISGAVAGLATITQASGFVQPMSALPSASSPASSAASWSSVSKSSSATTTPSTPLAFTASAEPWALCSPACFASGAINAVFGKNAAGKPNPTGAIDGNWHQVLNQSVGMGIGWALAIAGTLVLLFLVDKTMGLRVSAADEAPGLDLSQHGEEGYDLNS